MKKILMGILAMGMLGGSALSASAQEWRRDRDRDWRNDYRDRREDRRDIRRDEHKINHDRWELRRDLREGNYRGAEHERRELRNEYRDITTAIVRDSLTAIIRLLSRPSRLVR